jgi:hypothetical protein
MRCKGLTALIALALSAGLGVYIYIWQGNDETALPAVLPAITYGASNSLGIPAIIERPNNKFLRPFYADRADIKVV